MSRKFFLAALLSLFAAVTTDAKTKVLVVTGGHGFNRPAFFEMFQANKDIEFREAKHSKDASAFEDPDLLNNDVVVLYDMPKTISDSQKDRFLELTKKGIGIVALHHTLVSYQKHWPAYEDIIGGRYPEDEGKGGVVTAEVGYQHDVKFPVTIAREHPVTRGLKDFVIHDEIYWGYRVGIDAVPLLTTTHEKSAKTLAWTRNEGKSRVVYIQLGHGPEAFRDENYRKLVAQSIAWTAEKNAEKDWTQLFDGKTLNGWKQLGGKAEYRVENGEIVGKTIPKTPNSFLCTTKDYGDFVLELDFKVDKGLNSGVQVRSRALDQAQEFVWDGKQVKVGAGRVHGPQVEIDPSTRAWTGGVQGEGGRSWIDDLKDNEPARNAFKQEDWNTFRIVCKGQRIKTWLNGVPAADTTDDLTDKGFIALQVHGVGERTEPLEVRFKNIRLRELQ